MTNKLKPFDLQGASTMIDLIIWPDDEWCYLEELEEYGWKSDDYVRISVPDWIEEDDYPKYDDVIKGKTIQW